MAAPYLSPFWYRVAPLRPKLRAHARIARHRYRGQAWYVAQDEASGRHYRIAPASYLVIGLMDGTRSVDQVWNEVVDRLGDDAPSQSEVVQLLAQLHAADLVQCEVQPDTAELFLRFNERHRAQWLQKLMSPNALKWPMLDPDRFLERTVFLARPFFGRLGLVLWLAVVLPALGLVALNWSELTGNLADRLFATNTLITLALAVPLLKLLHELGHAYAVKVNGGAVHEAGLMFLVFVPMPYVDSSAATLLRSKWQRAVVAAAGMLVETFIAALATFVWVAAEPSEVRALAANVMLIAGVTTLVFNLNPLLRYDGYFILSDLIEIPNLGQRANRFWGGLVERRLFGAEIEEAPASRFERVVFILYAPAAFAYRMLVLLGISLLIATQFFLFGVLIALWGLVTGLVIPSLKLLWHVATSPRLALRRRRAVAVTFGLVAAACATATLVPLPLATASEGVVWLPEESVVRAGGDGFVAGFAAVPGSAVLAGQPLVRLAHAELLAEGRVIEAQIEALRARLQAEAFRALVQADLTRAEIRIREAALGRQREKLAGLEMQAGTAGTFIVPRADDLAGRFVRRGEVIGFVVSPAVATLRVVVAQDNVDLVRRRLTAISVRPAHRLAEAEPATILREVPAATDTLPSRALAVEGGGALATDPRQTGQPKTLQGTFQFDLALGSIERIAVYGGRAYVRFDHGVEPLAFQLWRRLRQLFLARLHA